MQDTTTIKRMEIVYRSLASALNERTRRQWAAAEAPAYGGGGLRAVRTATGMSVNTIRTGLEDLAEREGDPARETTERVRKEGGGRKCHTERDPGLSAALEQLIDPMTRGDPQSPLRWTGKSTTQWAVTLTNQGHPVSARTVGRLLRAAGYSLQSNRKSKEGTAHPDRNAQLEQLDAQVQDFQPRGQAAISADTKKKDLIGEFRTPGREWQPGGEPIEVLIHDFIDKDLGKAIPSGVYDLAENQGWVSVGLDHATAQFATETIRRWWHQMGCHCHQRARERLITAEGGGRNGTRCRLWKVALQDLATDRGLPIHVCHFPPGTSQWNKLEHRMFCHITQNWRGRPLISHDVIVNRIAATAPQQGLKIKAELDAGCYPTGIQVSDAELAAVNLKRADFHGEWNYHILPACRKK